MLKEAQGREAEIEGELHGLKGVRVELVEKTLASAKGDRSNGAGEGSK